MFDWVRGCFPLHRLQGEAGRLDLEVLTRRVVEWRLFGSIVRMSITALACGGGKSATLEGWSNLRSRNYI